MTFLRSTLLFSKYLAIAGIAGLLAANSAVGQSIPTVQPTAVTDQNRTGPLPFSSSVSSPVDSLDLSSGNLSLHIPILSVPGRNLGYDVELLYNANFWTPAQNTTGTYFWETENRLQFAGALGWSPNQPYLTWSSSKLTPNCGVEGPSGNGSQQTWSNYIFTDENGSKHAIDAGTGTGNCPGAETPSYGYTYSGPTEDSLGYWFGGPAGANLTTAKFGGNLGPIFAPSGNTYTQGGASPSPAPNTSVLNSLEEGQADITDLRGNSVGLYAGGTDSLGRTLLAESTPSANEVVYTFLDANGNQQEIVISLTTITIATDFAVTYDFAGQIPIHEASGTATAISSIVLPNGTSYSFTYDSYGCLESVTLPDGGRISYVWSSLADYGSSRRYVSQRTVNDGTNSSVWNVQLSLTPPPSSSGNISETLSQVTDPAGNASTYLSYGGSVYSASLYQGAASGTPLAQYTIDYFSPEANAIIPGPPTFTGPLPGRITTVLANNYQSKTEYDYDTFTYTWTGCSVPCNGGPQLATTRASRGNVEVRRDFDWASGSPGPLLRQTVNHYLHEQYPNYISDANGIEHNIVNRISEQDIYDGSVTCTYGSSCGANLLAQMLFTYDSENGQAPLHGEVAHVKRWLNTTGSYLTSGYGYDTYGNITSEVDANGKTTSFSYADSWGVGGCEPATEGNAFVTQRTDALGHSTDYSYNSCSGQLHSVQDPNDLAAGRAGTVYGYDEMNRVTGVMYPDGGQTTTTYNDTVHSATSVQLLVAGGTSISRTVFRDGLSRQKQMVVNTDPQGPSSVETTYDPVGRMQSVTNPHRTYSSPTDGTVSYSYDALGRMLFECNQDNVTTGTNVPCVAKASYKQWVYTGPLTDIYDEAQHHWQQTTDGLGRLIDVKEPNSSNSPTIETKYTYDALSNLLGVNQLGASGNTPRVRSFTYDSLSRLITANNPETGTVCYGQLNGSSCANGYDNNGNLVAKTDARGAVTNYTYDALNRITTKTYPNPPGTVAPTSGVNYFYDTPVSGWGWPAQSSPSYPTTQQTNLVGRLTEVTLGIADQNAFTVYGYDPMGRIVLKSECLPIDCGNNHHDIHFRYDLAGNLTFYDRGLNAVENSVNPNQGFYFGGFTQTYDGAGNLASVTGDTAGANLATNILSNTDYFPNGQLYTALKLGLYNDKYSVSPRQWYTGEDVTDQASKTVWQSTAARNVTGTVSTTTDTGAGRWSYGYDTLNRLQTAAGPNGSLAYTIDAFGNKLQMLTSGTGPSPKGYTVATNNNRLMGNGLTYDASGNVTYDGSHQYKYDAEGRLYQVDSSICYVYDGDGDRVARTNCAVSGLGWGTITGVETEFLYDTNHRLLAEVNAATQLMANGNIWAGGELAAQDAPDPNVTTAVATQLRIADPVGSLRGLLDLGEHVVQSCTSFPYGDGATCSTPADQFFTGKERDTESGLDYFGARYYASSMGRFLSPDWAAKSTPVPYAELSDPQSLNLYSYVRNNPLSRSDKDGHCDAPTNLKAGQVGVCVASYISAKKFDVVGDGDNRGTNGNGGTSRIQTTFTIDASGKTEKPTDGTADKVAQSTVLGMKDGLQGTGSSTVSPGASIDTNGNMHLSVDQSAHSAYDLDGALGDISNHVNLVVTPSGQVGVDAGSTARQFPALEIYRYTTDGTTVTTTLVHNYQETNPSALRQPEQPLAPQAPQ